MIDYKWVWIINPWLLQWPKITNYIIVKRCKCLLFMIMSFSKHFKSFKIRRKNKNTNYTCNLCYFNCIHLNFPFQLVKKGQKVNEYSAWKSWILVKVFQIWHKSLSIWHHRMKAHYGGVKIVDKLFSFKGIMFELQSCHYYEGFSQLFCILW